jgi:hypothetical protein
MLKFGRNKNPEVFMKSLFLAFAYFLLFLHPLWGDGLERSRVYKNDRLFIYLEELYISSGELNPSEDLIMTITDVKKYLSKWKEKNSVIQPFQLELLHKIENILLKYQADSHFSFSLGFDILAHSIPDCTANTTFYENFRDYDMMTKYEQRKSFAEINADLALTERLAVSTTYVLRNSWKLFNGREIDFARDLKEMNLNMNKKSILQYEGNVFSVIAGRDKIRLGVGESSSLLISEHLPPIDHFNINLNYGHYFTFKHYTASIKPNVQEHEYSKMIYAHSLTFRPINQLSVSLTEIAISNKNFKFEYLNPFLFYHNQPEYPQNRNIITAFEIEAVPYENIKFWSSFTVDELDWAPVEENGDMGREAFALLAGIKFYNPFRISQSNIVFEWSRATSWMYNYNFPEDNYYSLNYIYEENKHKTDTKRFHHFIGHRLGSNYDMFTLIYSWRGFKILYEYNERGFISIEKRAFSDKIPKTKEYRSIFGIQYKNPFFHDQFNIASEFYWNTSKNFHQIPDKDINFYQFWLGIEYQFLIGRL